MQQNSRRSTENGFGQAPTTTQVFFHGQTEPHSAGFQNIPRGQGPMILNHESFGGTRHNYSRGNSSFEVSVCPNQFNQPSESQESWSDTAYCREQTQVSKTSNNTSSDSVIINFDDGNEVLQPNDSSRPNLTRTTPEQCQLDLTSLHSFREIDQQTLPIHLQENYLVNSSQSNNIPQNAEVLEGNANASQNPGTQPFDKFFNKYVPFITFLSFKAIYDHREGILIFVGLLVTFIHANAVVKREIAKQTRRSFFSLSIIFTNLLVSVCFIYFIFQEQQLYKSLIFIPPSAQPLSIWDVLWIVGITDFVLKFITIQLKVGMTCFPAKFLPFSSRGKWYLVVECGSQLYRGLVPIQPWLYYLLNFYQGPDSVVGVVFSVIYIVSKGSDILSKIKVFLKAFWKLFHSYSLGMRPSQEQLESSGPQCPICHDEYSSPIVLHCRHIFCEGCVTTWFDREQTCPLCRAKVTDDPSWRDGATSFFTQLF